MADAIIVLPSDAANTGKDLDSDSLTVGSNTVYRQRIVAADPSVAAALARVLNANPATTDYGQVTRSIGRPAPSTTGTITSVNAAVTTTTVLASNTARLGAALYNDSTAVLYLALAASASTTVYTIQIPSQGYYELPNNGVVYTGILTGVWASATGAVRVTEFS